MSKFYKVWVTVEEQDTENEDHFEDMGQPEEFGEFDTMEDAIEFVSKLN